MFGLDTLNVVIGLVTVYLALGIACTAFVEAISGWLGLRSSNLEAAMREFLAGQLDPATPFATAFYDHPLVQALSKGRDGRPSYIPAEVVGEVVESLLTSNGAVTSLVAAVNALPDAPEPNRVKGLLAAIVARTGEDAAAFRQAVEHHFEAVMDRASGWFKRHAQNVALAVSAVLVFGANVDTLDLASSLASSPAARTKTVEVAESQLRAAETAEKTTDEEIKAGSPQGGPTLGRLREQTEAARAALDLAASNLEAAGLRFGWQEYPSTASAWVAKATGLLVSVLAVSLGAPFWFAVLQGFMQVRAAGVSPREKR